MSFIDEPPLNIPELAFIFACFSVSFTSRRNNDRFWLNLDRIYLECLVVNMNEFKCNISLKIIITYLSLFFIDKFLSTFSMRFSNHCAIVCCLSNGWDRMIFSLRDLLKWKRISRWKLVWINIMRHDFNNILIFKTLTGNNLRTIELVQVVDAIMTIGFYNLQTLRYWWLLIEYLEVFQGAFQLPKFKQNRK